MGANTSKVAQAPLVNEKLIIERLRAMDLKDQADNDFVHVEKGGMDASWRHKQSTLSSSEVEEWEHQLLQDPKNR